MRNEALDFAMGFVPLAVTGVVLTLSSGRNALVYCGTRTPIPPCYGTCSMPCAQTAWVPYSWGGLYLLAIGAALGAFMLLAGIPYPRTRAPGTGGGGPVGGYLDSAACVAPERNPSTTAHFSGCDTMPPQSNKSQARKDFVRERPGHLPKSADTASIGQTSSWPSSRTRCYPVGASRPFRRQIGPMVQSGANICLAKNPPGVGICTTLK